MHFEVKTPQTHVHTHWDMLIAGFPMPAKIALCRSIKTSVTWLIAAIVDPVHEL